MSQAPVLDMHLRSLRLSAILANYQARLREHTEPLPYLEALVALEISKRHENGNRARIAAAKFPTLKTLESFDFSLQSELPKAKLIEHFDGTFVGEHRNVIFTGPPGVGKSHLLSALGLALCTRGHRVYFTTAAALLMRLIAAKRNGSLAREYERSIESKFSSSTNSATSRSNEKQPTYFFNSFHNDTNGEASH